MRRFLFELVSDAEGRSDELALLSICGVLTYIGLELFAVVVRHQLFHPEGFGMGLGSAIAAGAFGMGVRRRLGDQECPR